MSVSLGSLMRSRLDAWSELAALRGEMSSVASAIAPFVEAYYIVERSRVDAASAGVVAAEPVHKSSLNYEDGTRILGRDILERFNAEHYYASEWPSAVELADAGRIEAIRGLECYINYLERVTK